MTTSLWSDAWKEMPETTVSDHQRDRVRLALQRSVGILNGSPGTGKTYTAAQIVKWIATRFGLNQIAVCCPTGKAAVRITSAMLHYAINLPATTIHRLLRIGKNGHGDGDWGFQYRDGCPLPFRFVLIDEASMVDTDLAAALLAACAPGTHVLWIGDVGQLPPVGHGAPLRDMIAAGVPCGELSEIRRNSGLIVEACAAIKSGNPFTTADKFDAETGQNLRHIEADTPEEAVATLQAVLSKFAASGRFNPVWQVQVLCAVNDKSLVSRKALNRALQAELNPNGEQTKPNPFRVADKIICVKNTRMTAHQLSNLHKANSPDNYRSTGNEEFVANGEIGKVVAIAPKCMVARFDEPTRLFKIPLGRVKDDADDDGGGQAGGESKEDKRTGTGCDFDLAYAITTHKSQGSEWPVAIVMIDDSAGAKRVCSREHIYTAISRGKQLVLTIGKMAALEGLAKKVSLDRRKTFLKELIGELSARTAAGLPATPAAAPAAAPPPKPAPRPPEPALPPIAVPRIPEGAIVVSEPELAAEQEEQQEPSCVPIAPRSFVVACLTLMIDQADTDRDLQNVSAELVRAKSEKRIGSADYPPLMERLCKRTSELKKARQEQQAQSQEVPPDDGYPDI